MGTRKFWGILLAVALTAAAICYFFRSPTGKEAVEAIDQTAGEVTGKRAIDQYQQFRGQVKDISSQQKERLQRMGLETGAQRR